MEQQQLTDDIIDGQDAGSVGTGARYRLLVPGAEIGQGVGGPTPISPRIINTVLTSSLLLSAAGCLCCCSRRRGALPGALRGACSDETPQ